MREGAFHDETVDRVEDEMRRFYNSRNLERYRKLASGVIDAFERRRLLELLSQEMIAFRREIGRE